MLPVFNLMQPEVHTINALCHYSCAGEYMTLPASQYSVLDAKRIERIDDDTFRCYVGGISFLNFKASQLIFSVACQLAGDSACVGTPSRPRAPRPH
jgi:Protein of unknown function (DUF1997)